MLRYALLVPLLSLLCLGLLNSEAGGWAAPANRLSAGSAITDTLATEHRVQAGETLIFSLPPEVSGNAVTEYLSLRTPPMSWLQDHSFMWETREDDAGRHVMVFLARFADAPEDSLHVIVEVEQ